MKVYIIKFADGTFDKKIYTKICYAKSRISTRSRGSMIYEKAKIIELDSSSGEDILTARVKFHVHEYGYQRNKISYIKPGENKNESEIVEDLSDI